MPTTQEILQALSGMQQNAQANVPVIPNNGNPAGAYNMPYQQTNNGQPNTLPPVSGQPDQGHYYPWMNPSPMLEAVRHLFGNGGAMPNQTNGVPGNTGIVPPNMQTGGNGQVQPVITGGGMQTGGPDHPYPVLPTGLPGHRYGVMNHMGRQFNNVPSGQFMNTPVREN